MGQPQCLGLEEAGSQENRPQRFSFFGSVIRWEAECFSVTPACNPSASIRFPLLCRVFLLRSWHGKLLSASPLSRSTTRAGLDKGHPHGSPPSVLCPQGVEEGRDGLLIKFRQGTGQEAQGSTTEAGAERTPAGWKAESKPK